MGGQLQKENLMHQITIAAGPIPWSLLFKTDKNARDAWAKVRANKNEDTEIEDDFGQSILLAEGAITSAVYEDLAKSEMAYVARALHQQKVQFKAQDAAKADTFLREKMRAQGPAVLSGGMPPMQFNNGR